VRKVTKKRQNGQIFPLFFPSSCHHLIPAENETDSVRRKKQPVFEKI
jgi:hypothetical protein